MQQIEANEIVPGLWQGSVPPRGTVLTDNGFQTLVLCAREHQIEATAFPGVEVIYAPNDDHPLYPFTRESLETAVVASRRVVEARKQGKKVLITCAAGINRSGLVTALTLHRLYGWDGKHCISVVRRRRHTLKTPLSNPAFTKALQRLPKRAPSGTVAFFPETPIEL